ncbi:type IV secretion system protein [Massilia sp. X63]|uniref:type IV secretion system protein n=1 Tax=Massilia sp. X63 TaxID=3237285 RepID=UPI0034DD208A
MKFRTVVIAVTLACASIHANAQMAVIDVKSLAEATKQVKAWGEQYQQMRAQIENMTAQYKALTGGRGMETILPALAPMLPADWAQSMRNLSSLAQQIRQSQAVLTPQQTAHMSQQLRQFLAQAQNLSAANQAMAQTAFNDAAARQSRLQTLTVTLARTEDPKAAYDLANRIAIEHAALLKDQNQLEAAASAAAAQDHAQRLMVSQMRAASAGTQIPKFDMPEL